MEKIPVSVVVVTRNEAVRIGKCLDALKDFSEVVVVDSNSQDKTQEISREKNARVIPFTWDGHYPKKRQWILDNIELAHDWVFFVDADQILTPDLVDEIRGLFPVKDDVAGFFVTGRYVIEGRVLRFGMPNRKIALFHRCRMEFPVVDDLDIPGMGEIEGHYQPVLKNDGGRILSLKSYLLHEGFDDERAWAFRHEKYARWEAGMMEKGAWPVDPVAWREAVKRWLRASPYRAALMLVLGYVLKMGVLDGKGGVRLAVSKYRYYKYIVQLQRNKK